MKQQVGNLVLSPSGLQGRHPLALAVAALVAVGAGCTGTIEPPGANGTGGGGEPGSGGTTTGDLPPGVDPGRVGIHRLNNTEYDNTVKDLLGVTAGPAKATFTPDEHAFGFDTIASAFGMTPAQYEQYFNAAEALTDEVFASVTLRARILTCTPSGATDATCLDRIIGDFGLRAWRRPLQPAELTQLRTLHTAAMTAGEDITGATKHVVRTMLASPHFLYRIELDAKPDDPTPHPVDAYGLAARLSYFLWSTMPDQALFQSAASGELLDQALPTHVDRMLADPKIGNLLTSFADQWAGMRKLRDHQVASEPYPEWNDDLRSSMLAEGHFFFEEFFWADRSLDQLFTADFNYVDARLAKLYGLTDAPTQAMRVEATADERVGFLGLAGFLTMSSLPHRTAPTLRGYWVLENLLCTEVALPPADVPKLEDAPAPMVAEDNVRARLEQHRSDPGCAGCHKILDPIGMGLEGFDAIGRHRTKYASGDAIDSSGVLPDGSPFSSLEQLAPLLAADERFLPCVTKKLMTYALGRGLVESDDPYVAHMVRNAAAQGSTLRGLIKQVALNDTFRMRRGEP